MAIRAPDGANKQDGRDHRPQSSRLTPFSAQNSSFFHIFSEPCSLDLTGVSGTLSVPNISLIDIICNQGCLLCYKINVSEKYLSTLLAQLTAV